MDYISAAIGVAAPILVYGTYRYTKARDEKSEGINGVDRVVNSKETMRAWVEANFVTRNELLLQIGRLDDRIVGSERLNSERHTENQRRSAAMEEATKENGKKLDQLVTALIAPDGRRRERPTNPGNR